MKKKLHNEEVLVSMLKSREPKSFTLLYDMYSKALFLVIIRIVKEQELAEDVLQDAFIKIWQNFESFDSAKGRLYTWLLNICRNSAIDALRSKEEKAKSKNLSITQHVYNIGTENKKVDSIGLNHLLNLLSEEHLQLLDLAYYQGYTHVEIAKILGMPIGTVKTKLRQAIIQLRTLNK